MVRGGRGGLSPGDTALKAPRQIINTESANETLHEVRGLREVTSKAGFYVAMRTNESP